MARRGKKIDYVNWRGFFQTFSGAGAGSVAAESIDVQTFARTLMRTRGQLLAVLDGVQTPGVLVQISIGFILVPDGTDATVLWDPFTDPEAPWFWVTHFALGYEEMVVDAIQADGASWYRETIDSKAMRKIPPDTEGQIVMTNSTLGGAGSVSVQVAGRYLFGR